MQPPREKGHQAPHLLRPPGMATAESRNAWSSSDILRAIALFFLVLLTLRLLWFSKTIIMVSILGVLFGLALSRGVDFLERFRIKRGIGAGLLVLLTLGLIAAAGALLAPTLKKQAAQLREKLPTVLDEIEKRTGMTPETIVGAVDVTKPGSEPGAGKPQQKPASEPALQPAQKPQQQPGEPGPQAQQQQKNEKSKPRLRDQIGSHANQVSKVLFPFVSGTVAIIGGLIFMIFMAMYIAADPKLYRTGLEHLIPPKSRPRGREVLDETSDLLRQWLIARLTAMVVVGVVTGGALALLGVPAAAALGAIAALLEFIPFIGPIAASIPAIGMALVVSPSKAVAVIILFILIQQFEGNLLTPLLMKRRLDVPPAVTIFAVSALGMIFGILGMLIAEPLSAVAILLTRRLYVDRIEANASSQ